MIVLERKALTEPSGKDSSHGNSLESSKLGESHDDGKQYRRRTRCSQDPIRNPGNARGTDRNRRVSAPLSPILYLFLEPSGKLYQKLQDLLAEEEQAQNITPPMIQHQRPVY